LVLAISFGISLGILVVFVNDIVGIAVAVFLVTANVVVASREDLTRFGEERTLIVWTVVAAGVVTIGSYYLGPSSSYPIFESLIIVNFFVLFVYIVMRIRPGIETQGL
jgi:hypothetical protein